MGGKNEGCVKPETRNPKPETRNPKPETRNPKPETRNPKPETRNMRLRDQVALITGAATGIGRACALTFAREGARLMIADVNAEAAQEVVDRINGDGGEAVFRETDVRQRAENDQMVADCAERFGRLDVLFCNAGVVVPKTITESTDEDIDRILDVNVKALAWAARAAVPVMLEQGRGNILFTASKTGLVAQTDSPLYCASKAAAILLAKALALDYATKGIRVNALCPGVIETPMLRHFADTRPDPDAAWEEYSRSQPMGRLGTPEECADAALWLVSDEARFVTGVALPIDGGFTAM